MSQVQSAYEGEVVRLRNRVEELEEIVAYLTLGKDALLVAHIKKKLKLTKQEATLVAALMTGRLMGANALADAVATDGRDYATYRYHQVLLCKIRRKVPWLEIETIWGIGYRLSKDMIEKLKEGFDDGEQ